ncbi:MAG: GtrA family protein [bacterium]|nr:GtrA family protein [bacterium]
MSRLLQIIRFGAAGATGVLLYYITIYVLTEWIGVWYIASAVAAFVINSVSSFTLQKIWTFQDKSTQAVPRQLVQYFLAAAVFLIANTGLLFVLVEYFHVWYLAAQLVLTVLFSIVNYFVSQRIFSSQAL